MITFFDVISLSAPHIYHSALPLSPQTSIICKLYKQYTRPLARVVRGLPSSWDPTVTTYFNEVVPFKAIWSPCNRFIAAVGCGSIVILDAATLSLLDTFEIPSQYHENGPWRPSLSPDSHLLTLIGKGELISWDLQTGGPLGAIPSGLEREANPIVFSSTYSEDGKVVAVAYYSANNSHTINYDGFDTFIRTYDLSGTEAGPHCAPKGRIIEPIWTHGKCIRFIIINHGSIAISEVEFTLKNPPVEVESLPIADKIIGAKRFLFSPSLSRLAFTLEGTIQVWDAKAAKLLLESELPHSGFYLRHSPIGSFSSDSCFFAYLDESQVVQVWEESPTGYVLHQKLRFIAESDLPLIEPCLSPSGKSIIMSPHGRALHLRHTRDQVPSLPSIPQNHLTLVFSPDERFAAFARQWENVVTIFDPLTGDLELAIDTDMGVMCLGIAGSVLIVVGEEKIVTWDLPGGDCTFNASVNDSVRSTTLHSNYRGTSICGLISPDFSCIAILVDRDSRMGRCLDICDMSTGRCLSRKALNFSGQRVGFTWDGREVWATCFVPGCDEGWKIVEDSGSGPIRVERRDGFVRPSGVFPWESRHGYEVTGDGWVLSATRKRLLWLPHRWRSHFSRTAWSGRFLGLLHQELSEVVILEFPE